MKSGSKVKQSKIRKRSGVWNPHEPTGNETGIQTNEITNNKCATCFGIYKDSLLPDGELADNWVECVDCKKWMHIASVFD